MKTSQRQQDKQHLTLRSLFYPFLKRKTDKAKFGLLGFIIITATVIAGCPMEVNPNIGPGTSYIEEKPPVTVTVTETETITEEVVVPVNMNRLRVINVSGYMITQVTTKLTKEGDTPVTTSSEEEEKNLSINDKGSALFIRKPGTYSVGITGPTVTPNPITGVVVPADGIKEGVVLITPSGIIKIDPDAPLYPEGWPNSQGSALLVVYNISTKHEITDIVLTPSVPDSWTPPMPLPRMNPDGYPSKRTREITPGSITYEGAVTRTTGGNVDIHIPAPIVAGEVYIVLIGDDDQTTIDSITSDMTPPPQVKDLVLTSLPDTDFSGDGSITAKWSPIAEPPDFARYEVYVYGPEKNGIPDDATTPEKTITGLSGGTRNKAITDGSAGESYSVIVVSVDKSGNKSIPTAAAVNVLVGIPNDFTIHRNKLNLNDQLINSEAILPPPKQWRKAVTSFTGKNDPGEPGYFDAAITWSTAKTPVLDSKGRFHHPDTAYTANVTLRARPGFTFVENNSVRLWNAPGKAVVPPIDDPGVIKKVVPPAAMPVPTSGITTEPSIFTFSVDDYLATENGPDLQKWVDDQLAIVTANMPSVTGGYEATRMRVVPRVTGNGKYDDDPSYPRPYPPLNIKKEVSWPGNEIVYDSTSFFGSNSNYWLDVDGNKVTRYPLQVKIGNSTGVYYPMVTELFSLGVTQPNSNRNETFVIDGFGDIAYHVFIDNYTSTNYFDYLPELVSYPGQYDSYQGYPGWNSKQAVLASMTNLCRSIEMLSIARKLKYLGQAYPTVYIEERPPDPMNPSDLGNPKVDMIPFTRMIEYIVPPFNTDEKYQNSCEWILDEMTSTADFTDIEHVDELVQKLREYFRGVYIEYKWLSHALDNTPNPYMTVGLPGWLW